ncbi:hypothetical protein CEXT_88391 [Caerostris extrusa]|uniref:Uncharacterized protein n=1 Tax=Caerostris extrusa TaxID=172846 RepID=A0AAV4MDY7_CAEEX|nr:hypothetical protein CEXT_88391 [Caerostris extrusa]
MALLAVSVYQTRKLQIKAFRLRSSNLHIKTQENLFLELPRPSFHATQMVLQGTSTDGSLRAMKTVDYGISHLKNFHCPWWIFSLMVLFPKKCKFLQFVDAYQ